MKALLILLLLPVIYFLLYNTGYMVTGSKTAKVFVGKNRGTNAYWMQFVECSGELKRMVRFRRCKEYKFVLDASIAEGTVSIEILDKEKNVVLRLTPEQPEASMLADSGQKYYTVYKFENASGTYEMTWE